MQDPVKHPAHYTSHPSGIECITITQHHNFCVGNALKYLWRQGLKQGEPSVRDLRKAQEYIEFEITRLESIPQPRVPSLQQLAAEVQGTSAEGESYAGPSATLQEVHAPACTNHGFWCEASGCTSPRDSIPQ